MTLNSKHFNKFCRNEDAPVPRVCFALSSRNSVQEQIRMAFRMSARNDDNDNGRPHTLDTLQILESNSTLTETTDADVTPGKSHSRSPSKPRNSGTPSIQQAPSYVSSASSTTGVPSPFTSHLPQTQEALPLKQLQYPPSPKPQMTTIDNSSPRNPTAVRKDSDDAILNIQPVHAFFNQHPGLLAQYDSDGSDGR